MAVQRDHDPHQPPFAAGEQHPRPVVRQFACQGRGDLLRADVVRVGEAAEPPAGGRGLRRRERRARVPVTQTLTPKSWAMPTRPDA
ncbi:hypothetical protein Saso_34510 [Streptomyces asoensis]|uniref:Uncharacterized protein n=1 Tax=Streptomyces asoensis TaxID=249586 RepID=A0ABQ3S147_9ACTN|nr:hypothetical protein GCM10010496_27860 [Streptomyces asoensis]GHI61801.1 hypothetical protein Saso_34510 [Streptomyces asoensis]